MKKASPDTSPFSRHLRTNLERAEPYLREIRDICCANTLFIEITGDELAVLHPMPDGTALVILKYHETVE